ncbi:GAF domain-containing protein [Sphingomonas sp. RS2018]
MPTDRLGETARIAALESYRLLDTPDEPRFDAITREAAITFGAEFAVISLISADRQWFKARYGVTDVETPRAISFCTHTIQSDDILCVPDTLLDPRFVDNPNVTGSPFVRFYSGAPLITPAGHRIGTLCVFDARPRPEIRPSEATRLVALAARTVRLFEQQRTLADARLLSVQLV